ncbi:uncharacterized protein LOC111634512 [Centruroides sculpturatus]|uniref:uncharacterized protein LOC111634512 n=1 Tax=Centruroides sculpturatus TaxID=218467 RepID=UPI000C6E21BF|nr:uncharacterized protein LOC111634512 [Centruroides sculpturatus]
MKLIKNIFLLLLSFSFCAVALSFFSRDVPGMKIEKGRSYFSCKSQKLPCDDFNDMFKNIKKSILSFHTCLKSYFASLYIMHGENLRCILDNTKYFFCTTFLHLQVYTFIAQEYFIEWMHVASNIICEWSQITWILIKEWIYRLLCILEENIAKMKKKLKPEELKIVYPKQKLYNTVRESNFCAFWKIPGIIALATILICQGIEIYYGINIIEFLLETVQDASDMESIMA